MYLLGRVSLVVDSPPACMHVCVYTPQTCGAHNGTTNLYQVYTTGSILVAATISARRQLFSYILLLCIYTNQVCNSFCDNSSVTYDSIGWKNNLSQRLCAKQQQCPSNEVYQVHQRVSTTDTSYQPSRYTTVRVYLSLPIEQTETTRYLVLISARFPFYLLSTAAAAIDCAMGHY